MRFSALLSVYHSDDPRYLEEALVSIWNAQTLKPDEVVIVNDGPVTPEIESCISRFEKIAPVKRVCLLENRGLGLALAEGIKYCSFEWVARMDSDDIADTYRFEKQVAYIHDFPDIDVLGTFIEEFTSTPDNVVAVREVPERDLEIKKMLKIRNAVNHVSVFIRKDAVLQAGNYQSMIYFEDYYLWTRMALQGAKFHNLIESLVKVRVGDAMIGRRKGRAYVRKELTFFRSLREIGFIGRIQYYKAIILRIPLRFLPAGLLTFIYKKLART
ncbi:MAG: glycosyltransferase [Eudoraea sp.]|nr:glycosyltransferase [Eudoraea sp.]